ncbi:MAG: hypothetical protein V3V16_05585 [Melioribacteraceae bacterium]
MKGLTSHDISERKDRPIIKYSFPFSDRTNSQKESRIFSKSKMQKELGYKPRERLREGFNKTAVWYRQDGLL